jgi:hypothetical protein
VLVRRLVHLVVALGLEEEVTDLARHHRDGPAEDDRDGGPGEEQHVGGEKAAGAEEVQGLVHAAVMVVAMVVPALLLQGIEKSSHPHLQVFRQPETSSAFEEAFVRRSGEEFVR